MPEKAVFEPLRGFYLAWSVRLENVSVFCQFVVSRQNFMLIFVMCDFFENSVSVLCTQVIFL